MRVWVGRNVHFGEVQGKSGSIEEACGRDAFFLRELEAGVFNLQDFRTSEVGTKLDMPHGRDRMSFLVNREFVDSLAT
jgi:hypothetical protein